MSWMVYNLIFMVGVFMIVVGVVLMVFNIVWVLKKGVVVGLDLWKVNMFEWFTFLLLLENNFDVVLCVCLVELMKDICCEIEQCIGVE